MAKFTFNMFKAFLGVIVLLIVSFTSVPDISMLDLSIYKLSVAVIILLVSVLLLGIRKGWGLLPCLNLHSLLDSAIHESPSRVLMSISLIICTLILTAACFH